MKNIRLMIPGPTEVSPETLEQLALPIRPHYGSKWMETYPEILKKLKKVFVTSNDIVVYAATGSAAIESAISSTIEPDDEVLVCHNGYFARRLIDMVESWGGRPIIVNADFEKGIDPAAVAETIKQNKNIKMLAMVHVETSTGVENNVKDICNVARQNGIVTLVDSIAGLGGCELPVDKWHIDFAVTSSQKCLESPAGLGFLSISEKAWEVISTRKTKVGGWYLNLSNIRAYQKKWEHWHPHGPNTAPVSLYMALNKSLDRIIREGLDERIKRHQTITAAVRKTLNDIGLKLFADDSVASKTLTAFLLPENIKTADFIKLMLDEHGILVGGDVGYVDKQLIRLGHMGISASADYLAPTFEALESSLGKLGFQFKRIGAKGIFTDAYEALQRREK